MRYTSHPRALAGIERQSLVIHRNPGPDRSTTGRSPAKYGDTIGIFSATI
jgi:hypothetical protein